MIRETYTALKGLLEQPAQIALDRRKEDSAEVLREGMPWACWGQPGYNPWGS